MEAIATEPDCLFAPDELAARARRDAATRPHIVRMQCTLTLDGRVMTISVSDAGLIRVDGVQCFNNGLGTLRTGAATQIIPYVDSKAFAAWVLRRGQDIVDDERTGPFVGEVTTMEGVEPHYFDGSRKPMSVNLW